MNVIKVLLIGLVLLVNVVIAHPAWADPGKFMKTPEYAEVTQAIADLTNPEKTTDLAPEAIQQKLADLRFQKYILETAEERSQVKNATGKTLGIYARPKKTTVAPTLYFLGTGQTTDDDFEVLGVYLPGSAPAEPDSAQQDSAQPEPTEATEAIALTIVPGTQLIVTTNPDTGVLEFNAPTLGTVKASDSTWSVPALTQADIDAQLPNAPVD